LEIIDMKRRIGMAASLVVVAALFLPGVLSTVNADTISSVTNGPDTSSGAFYWGETVTTVAGGPWNGLALNFYAPSGGPEAVGDVFLLSQEYLGTPANLSSSTPGFIGEGTATGGFYDFANAVTVLGGTEYWVYTDAALVLTGNAAGNEYYFTGAANGNFGGVPGADINYTLTGNKVPEPGAISLMLTGIALLMLMMRKRKTQGVAQLTGATEL
jgi:hypothetical protein